MVWEKEGIFVDYGGSSGGGREGILVGYVNGNKLMCLD